MSSNNPLYKNKKMLKKTIIALIIVLSIFMIQNSPKAAEVEKA
jgi:hypothetical protein